MVIECFLDWIHKASVAKRVEAAEILVRAFRRTDIEADKREELEAAITTLLEDPAPRVRLALAESFGAFPSAPRHVIAALAADNLDIATIVLSRSPVFLDAELVDIIRQNGFEKQIAVSCRPWLSPLVMSAICDHACKEACLGLLMNPASRFSSDNLHSMAQRHGTSAEIRLILMDRDDLPAETRLLLISKLGEALNSFVSAKSWMTGKRASSVVAEACDKASITFAASAADKDVDRLVKCLIDDGRLTASYLLRAVCMGNITLVAKAFSELSGVRFARVESILTRDRQSAFKAVYDRAGMPESAYSVFQCAISTWRRLLSSTSGINRSRLPFLVTREVLENYTGTKDAVVDELLILLRKLSAETARESARSKAVEISGRKEEQLRIAEIRASEVAEIEIVEDTGQNNPAQDNGMDTPASCVPADVEYITGHANFEDYDVGVTHDNAGLSSAMLNAPVSRAA